VEVANVGQPSSSHFVGPILITNLHCKAELHILDTKSLRIRSTYTGRVGALEGWKDAQTDEIDNIENK
jgi:hypothetical protein